VLIKLGGRGLQALGEVSARPFIGRICTDAGLPADRRGSEILLVPTGSDLPPGFRAYLLRAEASGAPGPAPTSCRDVYVLGADFDYLAAEDVVRIEPHRSAIHTLYRRGSSSNSLLVTERCDNYCVMCSQPPKARDDSWIADELLEVIPLISPETAELGLTGGEPSLLGDKLLELVARCRAHLPRTALHILSNGRSFADAALAKGLAGVGHPALMLGIPLYADVPELHDYVVQARGAFDETVRGILNLKQHGIRVELRFVIHADTFEGLPAFARFVARNLLFVDHVALMGLELMGFARANVDAIWIDPLDYQRELRDAALLLDRAGLTVSIYNHQLCVLDPELHPFARASISDWKNTYLPECNQCALRKTCGGFFASSEVRRSRGIAPRHRAGDELGPG
jgi:His-Xaa-Ser system radical SAM maturase HxsC